MKIRSTISIAGMIIALLLLFALPLRAQEATLLSLEGLQFDGLGQQVARAREWKFSWETIDDESSATVQINTYVAWITTSIRSTEYSNGRTKIIILGPPVNSLTIRVKVADSSGNSTLWYSITASPT